MRVGYGLLDSLEALFTKKGTSGGGKTPKPTGTT